MVANHSGKKRRFDCYPTEAIVLEQAETLAKHLSERNAMVATLTEAQAIEYAQAKQALDRFGVTVSAAAETIASVLKEVGSIANLHESVRFYGARHKKTTKIPVKKAVAELLKIKETRGASPRYLQDLKYRLNRFSGSFSMDACAVTTPLLQEWLDGEKLKPQAAPFT